MSTRATRPAVARALVITGFVLLYVLGHYLGRATRTEGSQLALVWPTAGIGVWFLASMRSRSEVWLASGAVLVSALVVNLATDLAGTISTVFALVNLAHAAAGLHLLRRLLPPGTGLREPEHVARLLLVAGGASAVSGVSSAAAAAALLGEPFWPSLLLFLVRNGGTTFVVLAAVLTVTRPHRMRDLVPRERGLELGLIVAGTAVVYVVVFAASGRLPVLFLALGCSVLVGTRLGVSRSGVLGLLMTSFAVLCTLLGRGALAGVDDPYTRTILVQAFSVLVLVVSLCLSTLQRTNEELATRLTASVARLRDAFDSALVGKAIVVRGGDGGWSVTGPNPSLVALLGRDPSGMRWRELLHPEDSLLVRAAIDDIAAGRRSRWEAEVRHRRPGDVLVWTQVMISPISGDDGSSAVVVQVLDITERRTAQEELERRANQDPLTGLPNRSMLIRFLSDLLSTPETAEGPGDPRHPDDGGEPEDHAGVAVLFLDLDRFKAVNDTYGHDAGDIVLVQVAEALRHGLRPGDLVSRLGGDEFVVCCPGVSRADQASRVLARLHDAVDPALLLHGRDVGLSLSVGVAISGHGDTADDLVRRADADMYVVKRRSGDADLVAAR